MSMYIYANPGDKVVYANETAGWDWDQAHAAEFLVLGNVYTVDHVEVDDSRTEVYLVEVPGESFNSVMFEDFR